MAAPSADVVVPGTGATTGAGEPSWREKRTALKVRASPVVIRCMLKKEDTRSRTLNDSSNSSDTDSYSGVTLNKKIVSSSQSLYSLATVGSQPLKLLCIYSFLLPLHRPLFGSRILVLYKDSLQSSAHGSNLALPAQPKIRFPKATGEALSFHSLRVKKTTCSRFSQRN